ncbi:unnamed protein product [Allacma fusca]|uniref:Uncharacterized protein n=1 Tax=Allacma fusca TaxID=39272 RepID=A0A8J2KH73_9HEXA|nr:unnamed protein product [Allacma fusca]
MDFQLCYPLVSDYLSSKWGGACGRIVSYFESKRKSLLPFGIVQEGQSCSTVAFFMLSAILRSKVKQMTQVDSAKSFID